jgi:choline dehydrogenase-like flavoprotein
MPSKIDIRDLSLNHTPGSLSADLCIVGSGPAGASLAMSLAGSPCSVLILESGAPSNESALATQLNAAEDTSVSPYFSATPSRNRILGGTSFTWSGRCRPLDEVDLRTRDWIPNSGWPLSERELQLSLDRARQILEIPSWNDQQCNERHAFEPDQLCTLADSGLQPIYWSFSRLPGLRGDSVRFAPVLRNLRASNVRILTNATVTELICSSDGGRIESLRVLTPQRRILNIHCRFVALCAGGIENARLLLASRGFVPEGIGNHHDLVGRFLMDHPRATAGEFSAPGSARVQNSFGIFRAGQEAVLQCGVSFTPETMRKQRLLNAAAWTTQHVSEDDVWQAARKMLLPLQQERWRHAKRVLLHSPQIAEGLWSISMRRQLPRRMGKLNLDVAVEQQPDKQSRITLSTRTDLFGTPLPRIDWRISPAERRSVIQIARCFDSALSNAGMPAPHLADWARLNRPDEIRFETMAHPIGTTRMANSPDQGVVDRNGLVFGLSNLYITGSSVFPTAGHANPTLMIVALALRLGKHLSSILAADLVPEVALAATPDLVPAA